MEFMDVVRRRRSVRRFNSQPVDRSEVLAAIEAASLAPSARNEQPWAFHVATGATRTRVAEIMSQSTLYLNEYIELIGPDDLDAAARFLSDLGGAPMVVGVSMPKADGELQRLNNCLSIGAAVQNFLLAATDRSLATCNVTFSYWVRDELAPVLSIPDDRKLASLLLVGYTDVLPDAPPRRTSPTVFLE